MRKIILAIEGALIAFFGLFGVEIGLVKDVNEVGVIAGLLIVGVWVFTEAKKDLANLKAGLVQVDKYSDPAFWTSLATAVLIPFLTSFGIQVSDATISIAATVLAVVVPILIKVFRKTVKVEPVN
jgi:hypothetical protein